MCDVCRGPQQRDHATEATLRPHRDRKIDPARADRDRLFLRVFDSLTVSERQTIVDRTEQQVRDWRPLVPGTDEADAFLEGIRERLKAQADEVGKARGARK